MLEIHETWGHIFLAVNLYGNFSGVNTGTAIIQYCHERSALLNYNVSTLSCQPMLMTHKYCKPDNNLYSYMEVEEAINTDLDLG